MRFSFKPIHNSLFKMDSLVGSKRVVEVEDLNCCGEDIQSTYRATHDAGFLKLQAVVEKRKIHKSHEISKRQVREKGSDEPNIDIKDQQRMIYTLMFTGAVQRDWSTKTIVQDFAIAVSAFVGAEFADILHSNFLKFKNLI